jgi:hypothetical protein
MYADSFNSAGQGLAPFVSILHSRNLDLLVDGAKPVSPNKSARLRIDLDLRRIRHLFDAYYDIQLLSLI